MDKLKQLFDSVTTGKEYRIGLALPYIDDVATETVYKVLSKKDHSDFSYSLFCQCVKQGGVIYLWIVPKWNNNFSLRVVSIVENNA
jgi:hypothetical protein